MRTRDGSAVRVYNCSWGGSRHSTPAPRDPVSSSGLQQSPMQHVCTHTYTETHAHAHAQTHAYAHRHTHTHLKIKELPGVVVHAFNPSTWEAEAGGFLSSRTAWSTK
jgi:short-subunit dehydrogenase involved in D-alanine esterification of teichoic acids